MNDPLRAGIIGCGNIALGSHAPTLRDLDDVEVVAIADPVAANRQRVQAVVDLPDSACFEDYQAVLDVGVDYLVVTVPQKFRRPIVEDCAARGVHVLSEKPVAIVPAEAEAMIKMMRDAGLRFGMVHNYLFYPEYVLAQDLIGKGEIGTLRHVMLNFLGMPDHPGAADYRPRWRHDPDESGGGLLMDMIHGVYVADFFMEGPIRAVSAVIDNLDQPDSGVEDMSLVHFTFDTGYAALNLWWGRGTGGLEVSGTDGRILVFYENYETGPFTVPDNFVMVNDDGRQDFEVWEDYPRDEHIVRNLIRDTFKKVHVDFGGAIREERDPVAPAEEGLAALEATLAAYASGATGRVVSLPLSKTDPIYQKGVAGLRELPVWEDSPIRKRGVLGL